MPRTYRAAELSVVTEVTEAANIGPLTRTKERHSAIALSLVREASQRMPGAGMQHKDQSWKQPVGVRAKVKQLQSKRIIKGSKKPWFQSGPVIEQRRSQRQRRPAGEWWQV